MNLKRTNDLIIIDENRILRPDGKTGEYLPRIEEINNEEFKK